MNRNSAAGGGRGPCRLRHLERGGKCVCMEAEGMWNGQKSEVVVFGTWVWVCEEGGRGAVVCPSVN